MSRNTLFDDLKSEMATGRVVVIAGTGVSITASGDKQVDGHAVAHWDEVSWYRTRPSR